jgi:C-terminal processing protease CtpA/Prc/Tol biopolymer transport system component
MKKLLLSLIMLITISISIAQNNPLINTPSLSPNGQSLAFNYQGDIWTVSINGENLKRLTIHEAYDANPKWSADGKKIAFQSDRFGNNDIFTISAEGGTPNRITYHSSSDVVTDFTADGNILFATSRNYVQLEREPEIHSVNANGGTPFRLLNAVGFDATLSPNKQFIAFTRGSCRIEREAYQGPANRDVWIYNIANNSFHELTNFQGQDLAPQWANNSTLYFQSARSGVYNVHKLSIDENGNKTGEIEQISSLKDLGLFSYDLSANGKDIVMVSGDNTSLLNAETKEVKPLNIVINSDYRFDPSERKTFSGNASEVEVSPNGKYSAIVIRGEIFITENDTEKSKSVNVSNSPYRDIDITWLNDDTLLFVSDRDGVNNLYAVSSSDENNKNIFTSLKHKILKLTNSKDGITAPRMAPDNKSIAFNEGNGKLIIAAISETGKISNEKTLVDSWDSPSGVAWSPDSKWVSYSLSDLYFNEEVYIHKADNSKKPVNISMHPKSDGGAIWSKDGSKIAFSSNRNNGDHDVWFVWLRKQDWEKTRQDWEETPEEKPKKDEKSDDKKEDKKVADIIIDFDKIHERQTQVTSFTGGEYLTAISNDGETFYYTTGNSGRGDAQVTSDLFSIKWNGKDKKEVTKGGTSPRNVSLTPKNDYIYFLGRGKISRIKVAGLKKEGIPFSAKMVVDYNEESNQIFEEAWRVIKDRFYDPNHHGKNWETLKKTYKPLAMKASTRADFKTIFNIMLGQINASHMGMYSGEDRKSVQRESTGILGLEFKPVSNGKLSISKIVENSAATRESSKLAVGDIINAINGNEVSVSENIYKHLIATNNEKIILDVTSNGVSKEVVIRPKSNGRTDNYNAWVNEQKRLTEIYSGGKLGYIHIQGMNWPSFERFERELAAAGDGKEGIVIDVRYNGGGWTTDYLMAVLNVKQHAYTVPRGSVKNVEKEHKGFTKYYPYSERLPLAAWTKPSIALCNENSYSNAEIFSHAYKELGLGKLVGQPTFGAVISTGGHTLIDGSYVRVPFRGWFVKSSEKNMDFTPAMPDILVENAPDDKANGKDSQLKRAVDELLKQL